MKGDINARLSELERRRNSKTVQAGLGRFYRLSQSQRDRETNLAHFYGKKKRNGEA